MVSKPKRVSVLLIALACFVFYHNAHAQSVESLEVSDAERKDTIKLLVAYDNYSEKVPRIAVVAKVTYFAEDLLKNNAYSKEFTYVKCCSPDGVTRFDSFSPVLSFNNVIERLEVKSIVYDNDASWFYSGRPSGTLRSNQKPEDLDLRDAGAMVMLEPLRLPVVGHNVFTPSRVRRHTPQLMASFKITKVQQERHYTAVELCVSEKDHIYMRVIFDKLLDGMPVERRLTRGNDPGIEIALTKTKWEKINSLLLPTKVTAMQILGGKKPSFKGTWEVSLSWCKDLKDTFGDDVYKYDEEGLKISPQELEQHILENAGRR